MPKKKKAKGKSARGKVGLGAAFAGAAVAATAGAYYLYGHSGVKHRRQIKGWMLKAKGEVLERAEKLKEVDAKAYHRLVDEVSKKYKKFKHVNTEDVVRLSRELKAHFANIEKDLEKRARSGKRVVKRVVKKVVRSTQIKKKVVSKKKSLRRNVVVKSSKGKTKLASKKKRTTRKG